MEKRNPDVRLERFNVVLSLEDIAWLDQLAGEIYASNGARLSRSEIIRAAIATLKELHKWAPRCPGKLLPLAECKSGADLVMAGVIAMRRATTV
jgi:hypothetical protein